MQKRVLGIVLLVRASSLLLPNPRSIIHICLLALPELLGRLQSVATLLQYAEIFLATILFDFGRLLSEHDQSRIIS